MQWFNLFHSQCTALLDAKNREDFIQDVQEEYEDIRDEHFSTLKEMNLMSLEECRTHKLRIDWSQFSPRKPMFLGRRNLLDYNLDVLLPYIDWKPFFDVWQLRGRYPNRGFPKIFKDAKVGLEAKSLYDEAQKLLSRIQEEHLLRAHGVVAFYAANSRGDDILIYDTDSYALGQAPKATLHCIRQQMRKDTGAAGDPYLCLSDFVAPVECKTRDYVGMFAVSAGFGCSELCKQFEASLDDFNAILVKAIADRLAEAFAEELHEKVRKELWGYSQNERFSAADLHKVKYEGIRPAPGYPTQPDHTEKSTLWELMEVAECTGISLTDTLAMQPAASVCGLYFSHPESRYFSTGKINKDQVTDYAQRKQMSVAEVEYWLAPILAYESDEGN